MSLNKCEDVELVRPVISFAVTYVIVLVHVCIHAIYHACYVRPHGRI